MATNKRVINSSKINSTNRFSEMKCKISENLLYVTEKHVIKKKKK